MVGRITADIRKIRKFLGHRHIIITQIYDKRRRSASESTQTCPLKSGPDIILDFGSLRCTYLLDHQV